MKREAGAERRGERPTRGADHREDGRRLRWEQHRAERRVALVRAGLVAVDRYGVDASAEQVAEVAGISRTVLYRYFRDRADLRRAIADRIAAGIVRDLGAALVAAPTATPREVIEPAVGMIVGWFADHPNLYRFLRTRHDAAALATAQDALSARLARLVRAALAPLGIPAVELDAGARAAVGLVDSVCRWWLEQRAVTRQEITEYLCRALWHVLGGSAYAAGVVLSYDKPLPPHRPDGGGARIR